MLRITQVLLMEPLDCLILSNAHPPDFRKCVFGTCVFADTEDCHRSAIISIGDDIHLSTTSKTSCDPTRSFTQSSKQGEIKSCFRVRAPQIHPNNIHHSFVDRRSALGKGGSTSGGRTSGPQDKLICSFTKLHQVAFAHGSDHGIDPPGFDNRRVYSINRLHIPQKRIIDTEGRINSPSWPSTSRQGSGASSELAVAPSKE